MPGLNICHQKKTKMLKRTAKIWNLGDLKQGDLTQAEKKREKCHQDFSHLKTKKRWPNFLTDFFFAQNIRNNESEAVTKNHVT